MFECIRIVSVLTLSVAFAIVFPGCSSNPEPDVVREAGQPFGRVAVTNFPLFCFVSRLCEGHEFVNEVIYVGPGQKDDPHSWMPTGEQIRDLQKVDLVICNGPGAVFSNWMEKVTIDESKLCKTTNAVKLTEFVVVKDFQLVHSHGPEGEHSHSWVVPQSWLSPSIARKQAKYCFDQLTKLYGQTGTMDNSFADLQKEFDRLESKHETLKLKSGDLVVASSTPDLQYLTRSLGWNDRYLHWNEPRDIEQATKEISEMRERYQSATEKTSSPELAKQFLWSGKKWNQLSELVAQRWKKEVLIDLIDAPNGTLPKRGDYFARMENNLDILSSIVE